MKRKMLLTAILLCFTSTLFAAPKTEEYKATMEAVWSASIRAASQQFTLLYSDPANRVLTFQTGHSFRSNGFNVSVTFRETDEQKIEVSLTAQKNNQLWAFGAGGSIAKKFFKAVGENLKAKQ